MTGRRLLGLLSLACACAIDRDTEAVPPDTLFALGDSLSREEAFDSAHAVWSTALDQAVSMADSAREARLRTEIGIAAYRLTRLEEARTQQELAVALKVRLGMDTALSRSSNALGLVLRDEGNLEEAARLFTRAAAEARASFDTAGLARATGNLGLILLSLGSLDSARTAFRELRAAGKMLGNTRYEANGLANEAMLDVWSGDPAPAIARIDTARTLYRQIGYRTGEQNALGQLGTAFELTGEFDRAFAAYDSSLALARDLESQQEEADLYRLIAGLHAAAGDWRQSIRYYEQADSLFQLTGATHDRGAALRGAATGYLELRNARESRLAADAALALHLESKDLFEQLDDRLLLAEIAMRSRAAGTVDTELSIARTLATRLNTRAARISTALAEARWASIRNESRQVLAITTGIRRELPDFDPQVAWQVDGLAARAWARQDRLDSAEVVGRRAVTAVEWLRGHLTGAVLQSALVAERADVYGDLVMVLLRQGQVEAAFEVADAARSRQLLEHLSPSGARQVFPDLAQAEALLRRIDQLAERLRATAPEGLRERGAPADTVAVAIARELSAARSEYEAVLARSAGKSPRALALLGAGSVSAGQLRSSLVPGEALVEYFITSDRLLTFVVGPREVRFVETSIDPAALEQRIGVLQDLWGRRTENWRTGLPASRALHDLLIAPLALDSVHRLVIVPHGVLGLLPFGALQDRASGRWLAEDVAITVMPTASALGVLRQGASAEGARLEKGLALAPFPRDLPGTSREATAFRTAMPGSRAVMGSDATELALREGLARQGPVHVASHGTLNAWNPLFSRIELVRPRTGATPSNDGRLEVHELLGLVIRSPLVFFSGCETGRARAVTRDPVRGTVDLTLAQAALAAGAANVISTLWRIDDAGAGEFAARFYAHLKGSSVAARRGARATGADRGRAVRQSLLLGGVHPERRGPGGRKVARGPGGIRLFYHRPRPDKSRSSRKAPMSKRRPGDQAGAAPPPSSCSGPTSSPFDTPAAPRGTVDDKAPHRNPHSPGVMRDSRPAACMRLAGRANEPRRPPRSRRRRIRGNRGGNRSALRQQRRTGQGRHNYRERFRTRCRCGVATKRARLIRRFRSSRRSMSARRRSSRPSILPAMPRWPSTALRLPIPTGSAGSEPKCSR